MKSVRTKPITSIIAMVLCLGSASVALAKPVCISSDSGVDMKFAKVKIKAGTTSALTGVTQFGHLVTGAVYTNAAGTATSVHVNINIAGSTTSGLEYAWTGNLTLAGTGDVDFDEDAVADDVRTFSVLDCAMFTNP